MNKKKLFKKVPGVLFGLIGVLLYFSVFAEGFFSAYNLQNLLKDCSILVIVAMGMNLVIISGRMNIAVGGIMSLSGVVAALLLKNGFGLFPSIFFAVLVGTLTGAVIGYLIAYLNFNDWVVSYAFMGIAQGVALALANGNTVPVAIPTFRRLASGTFLGVFNTIWIAALLSVAVVYASRKTKFGYSVYSVGGSMNCARISGINIKKTLCSVYMLSCFLAAVSGVLAASKSNSASPIGGSGYEWDSIAATLIGGTSFNGGIGSVYGCIIGAVLMRSLRNGLAMRGLSPYWQTFIIGAVVMCIIIADGLNEHRKKVLLLRRVYKS